MDLQQQVKIVDNIHDTLEGYVGKRLKVRANLGRSKIVENEGLLMQVHQRLFIVEVDRKRGRTSRQSYQFADILTGTVELSLDGEPIFEPFVVDDDYAETEIIENSDADEELGERILFKA